MGLKSAFSGDEGIDRDANDGTYPMARVGLGSLSTTSHPIGFDADTNIYTHARGTFRSNAIGTTFYDEWGLHANSRQAVDATDKAYTCRFRFYASTGMGVADGDIYDICRICDSAGSIAWVISIAYVAATQKWTMYLHKNGGYGIGTLVALIVGAIDHTAGTTPYSFIEFWTDNDTGAGTNEYDLRVVDGHTVGSRATGAAETNSVKAESLPQLYGKGVVLSKGGTSSGNFFFADASSNDSKAGMITGRLSGTGATPTMGLDNATVYSFYPNRDGAKNDYRKLTSGLGGGSYAFCLVDDQEDSMATFSSHNSDGIKGVNSTDEQEMYFDILTTSGSYDGTWALDTIYGVCFVLSFKDSSAPTFPSEIGITADGESEGVYTTASAEWNDDTYVNGGHVWLNLDKSPAGNNWTADTIRGTKIRLKGITTYITQVRLNILGDWTVESPAGDDASSPFRQDRMDKNAALCPASLPPVNPIPRSSQIRL